jgi:UTP-glucose-1-phosphate uridylyltransferase
MSAANTAGITFLRGFLPGTKAQPKEMLPLVDKPIIQYVVEEAVVGTGATKAGDVRLGT